MPMGRVLKAVPQVRNPIKKMVETGMISGPKADAWKKRIEEGEVARMRQRCHDGDIDVMRSLGNMCRFGNNGLRADSAQGSMWIKQAADLNDPEALGCVGDMYCEGDGVEQNSQRGSAYLGRAAALGSSTLVTS